jgi:hypothetical protein
MGKIIKCLFWCNSGHTEEEVEIEIDTTETEETQIQKEFHKWLDNNEDCGYKVIQQSNKCLKCGASEYQKGKPFCTFEYCNK